MSTSSANNPDHHLGSYGNLGFQITWPGDGEEASSIWLVASNLQEKEAWCSDISQVRGAPEMSELNVVLCLHEVQNYFKFEFNLGGIISSLNCSDTLLT